MLPSSVDTLPQASLFAFTSRKLAQEARDMQDLPETSHSHMLRQFLDEIAAAKCAVFDRFWALKTGPGICLRYDGIFGRYTRANLSRWVASEQKRNESLSDSRKSQLRIYSLLCLNLALKFEGHPQAAQEVLWLELWPLV